MTRLCLSILRQASEPLTCSRETLYSVAAIRNRDDQMWTIQGIENIEKWTIPSYKAKKAFAEQHYVLAATGQIDTELTRIRSAIVEYDYCIGIVEATCKLARQSLSA